MFGAIVWGATGWLWQLAAGAIVVGLLVIAWSYWSSAIWRQRPIMIASILKSLGIIALALCVLEPLLSGTRPRQGENLFLLLADNSKSLQLKDDGTDEARSEKLLKTVTAESAWQKRLEQDFEIRRYCFDAGLRPVESFSELELQYRVYLNLHCFLKRDDGSKPQ